MKKVEVYQELEEILNKIAQKMITKELMTLKEVPF